MNDKNIPAKLGSERAKIEVWTSAFKALLLVELSFNYRDFILGALYAEVYKLNELLYLLIMCMGACPLCLVR